MALAGSCPSAACRLVLCSQLYHSAFFTTYYSTPSPDQEPRENRGARGVSTWAVGKGGLPPLELWLGFGLHSSGGGSWAGRWAPQLPQHHACLCLPQIVAALDANPTTKRTQLQHKFEQVIALMEDNIYESCSEA